MFNLNKKDYRRIDFILILSVIALLIIGLVVLSSAIRPNGESLKTQLIATILGFLSFFIIFFIDFDLFKKLRWLVYLVIIAGLASTM